MKHLKLFEAFCEGDLEDIQSYIRKQCPYAEFPHYGFDYLEAKMNCDEETAETVKHYILNKFEDIIQEIYSEESSWIKIYFKN